MPVLDTREWQAEADRIAKDATGNVISETTIDPSKMGTAPAGTNPNWLGYDGTREGSVSDNELSDGAREAVQEAVRTLGPHVDHPAVGGVIGRLQSLADEPEPRHPGDGDGDTLADELAKVEAVRSQIRKGETHASPEMRERLDRAATSLQDAYLRRVSPGHERAELAKAHDRSLLPTPLVA